MLLFQVADNILHDWQEESEEFLKPKPAKPQLTKLKLTQSTLKSRKTSTERTKRFRERKRQQVFTCFV